MYRMLSIGSDAAVTPLGRRRGSGTELDTGGDKRAMVDSEGTGEMVSERGCSNLSTRRTQARIIESQ